MTIDHLGNLGDFLGGVGVFVTLLYLAFQVRHNTSAMRTASRQEIVEAYRTWNRIFLNRETTRAFARSLALYPNVPFEERSLFTTIMADQALFFQSAFALYESGHLPEVNYSPYLDLTASLMATPGGALWWDESRSRLPSDMVRAVDVRVSHGDLPDATQAPNFRLDEVPAE